MTRLRLGFALLSLLLLGAMALLAQRALRGASLERDVRHSAVAERVFDELERELSRILQREEERPVGQYRFYYVPEGIRQGGAALAVSPLSRPPTARYVLGHFQVDPDGRVTTPLVPLEPAPAERRGDYRPSRERAARVAALRAVVTRALGPGEARLAAAATELEQAPGTTRELRKSGRADAAEAAEVAPEPSAPADAKTAGRPDAYDVLRSFNLAADARSERQEKRVVAQLPTAEQVAEAVAVPDPGFAEGQLLAEGALTRPGSDLDALEDAAGPEERDAPAPSIAGRARAPAPRRASEAAGVLRSLVVQPMLGRLVDPGHLVLYRTVLAGERGYRQGLVLDTPSLFRHLEGAVLAGSRLAGSAELLFSAGGEGAAAEATGSDLAYLHRFAEPFDALAVRMRLPPLPGAAGSQALYAVAVLMLVSGAVGLLALYRMVAVSLRFAQRRSNFAAAVSHELKTPLTSIRMYGEMLRDGMVESDEKRAEYYATITGEAERLSRLIDNVLEFSKLERGTRKVDLVVGSLAPVLREAAGLLEPHARELGFALRVEVEDDLPAVRFERDALFQVVFNLVDNALKYARDAGDRVVVLECRRAAAGAVLCVRDRGPGVPARHHARIFEAFYRGEDELTRTARGTGIGLALVKGLAERMGAAVDSRNAAEGGFEVSLTFRAA